MMRKHNSFCDFWLTGAPLGAALLVVLVLVGCGNMVSMDQLAANISGDISGAAPKVVVTQGTTRIASGSGYDFGSVVADGIPGNFVGSPVTFTITNGGGSKSTLTISAITVTGANSGDFVASAPGLPWTLAYNDSKSFTIAFDPATIASGKSATVTISSSDPAASSSTFAVSGIGAPFSVPSVTVPSGTYSMGFLTGAGTSAATTHSVTLSYQFSIGIYELTYQDWANVKAWAVSHGYVFTDVEKTGDGRTGATALEPVTNVSWRDAVVWCNAASELAGLNPCYYTDSTRNVVYKDSKTLTLPQIAQIGAADNNACVHFDYNGYRLPTEAEWEYAARKTPSGVTDGDRASGDQSKSPTTPAWGSYAWYTVNSGAHTHIVGSVPGPSASQIGLYDMSGNVYEWCWDWYNDYTSTPVTDPYGPATSNAAFYTNRVYRGGFYNQPSAGLATSYRDAFSGPPDSHFNTVGFRIVRK